MELRKFTKKGRAELKEERRLAEGLDATIVAIARLMVEDSLTYDYCQARDLWESHWYKRHCGIRDKVRAMLENRFSEFGGKVFSISIRGCASVDSDNYDLDDAIRERFPGQVSCDSESGGLFMDCVPEVQDEILAALKELDPRGDFEAEDMIAERERMETAGEDANLLPDLVLALPFSGNWPGAKKFLEERGIEVTVDFSDAPGPSSAQVQDAREELTKAVLMLQPDLPEETVDAIVEYTVVQAEDAARSGATVDLSTPKSL